MVYTDYISENFNDDKWTYEFCCANEHTQSTTFDWVNCCPCVTLLTVNTICVGV